MFSAPATRCPVCGGDVHPVAGRCKHCKQDLVELRARQVLAAAPPAPTPAPAPAPAPVNGTPPQGSAPAPEPAASPQQPQPPPPPIAVRPPPRRAAWWRRWPLYAGGAALFLLGLAAGMMIERQRGPEPEAAPSPISRAGTAPSPGLAPDSIPTDPLPGPGPGGSSDVPPPPARGAADVAAFVEELGTSLCDKAVDCGLFPARNRADCQAAVKAQPDPDAAAKIARGECRWDPAAAAECLRLVEAIDCAPGASTDALFNAMSGSIDECERAFACR